MATFLFGVLAAVPERPAFAWDYLEHVAITYVSLSMACSNLTQELAATGDSERVSWAMTIAAVCSEPVKQCLSHLTAVSADYVDSARTLEQDAQSLHSHYLIGGGLDCRSVGSKVMQILNAQNAAAPGSGAFPPTSEMREDYSTCALARALRFDADKGTYVGAFDWENTRLIRGKIFTFWHWSRLALKNSAHFQPSSRDHWLEYELKVQAAPKDASAEQLDRSFRDHAFAMHFLEDSFPAGHVGLDRSPNGRWNPGLRQDYAHAYHDDMNGAGQFLATSPRRDGVSANAHGMAAWKWFGFGDDSGCQPTVYLNVSRALGKWPTEIDAPADVGKLILRAIPRSIAPGVTLRDSSFEDGDLEIEVAAAARKIERQPNDQHQLFVLSLREEESFLRDMRCILFGICQKAAIVLTADDAQLAASKWCSVSGPNSEVSTCHDTSEAVLQAAIRAQEAFLRQLLNDPSYIEYLDAATDALPAYYGNLVNLGKPSVTGRINADNVLMTYEDPDHNHPITDDAPVSGTSEAGINFMHLFGGAGYHHGDEINVTGEINAFAQRDNPEISGILVEEHHGLWRPFGGGSLSYPVYSLRPSPGNMVTPALGAAFGVDRIWDGPDRRSLYFAAQPRIDIEAGRFVVFTQLQVMRSWNSRLGWDTGFGLTFGLRVPSLNLLAL